MLRLLIFALIIIATAGLLVGTGASSAPGPFGGAGGRAESGETVVENSSEARSSEGAAVAERSTDSAFVASSRGTVYYPRGCPAWERLSSDNRIWFGSEQAARAAGYTRTSSRQCHWEGEASRTAPRVSASAGTGAVGQSCTVSRIVDGDTLICEEGGERIRLLLVDAPELSQGEPGRVASEALATMLPPGTRARVERDVQERDRYRRLLAYLYDAEGRMVNEELARIGVVTVSVYPPNVRHVERIRAAVEEARSSRRGLWSGSAFECAPADYRAGRCR